jgi:hypothetical protein
MICSLGMFGQISVQMPGRRAFMDRLVHLALDSQAEAKIA